MIRLGRVGFRVLLCGSALAASSIASAQESAEQAEMRKIQDEMKALQQEVTRLRALLEPAPPFTPPLKEIPQAPNALAFNCSFDGIFKEPNTFLDPRGAPKPLPECGVAQSTGSEEEETESGKPPPGTSRSLAAAVGAFLFDRPVDRRASGISLEVSTESSRLGLQFAFPRAGKYLLRDVRDGPITGDAPFLTTYTVGVSAAAKDGFGQVFKGGERSKGGGFIDDITASFGFSRTFYKERTRADMELVMKATEAGVDIGEAKRGADLVSACRKGVWAATPNIAATELNARCSGEHLRAWALAAKSTGGISTFANQDARDALRKAVWGLAHPVWDAGINLDLGYRAFTYRLLDSSDPAEFDPDDAFRRVEHKPTEFDWKVSAHFGKFIYRKMDVAGRAVDAVDYASRRPTAYAALLSEAGREWELDKAFDDQVICQPRANRPELSSCSELDIGAPRPDWFWRIGGQMRFAIRGISAIPEIGFAPKVTIDVTDGQFAWDLPISFLQSSDGTLKAGIRFRDEMGGNRPEDFSVGFFLGTAFKVGG